MLNGALPSCLCAQFVHCFSSSGETIPVLSTDEVVEFVPLIRVGDVLYFPMQNLEESKETGTVVCCTSFFGLR